MTLKKLLRIRFGFNKRIDFLLLRVLLLLRFCDGERCGIVGMACICMYMQQFNCMYYAAMELFSRLTDGFLLVTVPCITHPSNISWYQLVSNRLAVVVLP